MQTAVHDVRVLQPQMRERPRRQRAWGEILFLVLVVALHALPVVALWTGRSWGTFAEGYGILVVLLAGRELAHELRGTVSPDESPGEGLS